MGGPPLPPRIFNGGGDAHRVKGDAHPPLPHVHPPLPHVPVTPYVQLKFLVGNNLSPPSPLRLSITYQQWYWQCPHRGGALLKGASLRRGRVICLYPVVSLRVCCILLRRHAYNKQTNGAI